jgi:hypothetical protein
VSTEVICIALLYACARLHPCWHTAHGHGDHDIPHIWQGLLFDMTTLILLVPLAAPLDSCATGGRPNAQSRPYQLL